MELITTDLPSMRSLFTDFWSAYEQIIPSEQHCAVGKESGKTNHIERFNLTLKQRVLRLLRKTLSFSKKIENHIRAIWNLVVLNV